MPADKAHDSIGTGYSTAPEQYEGHSSVLSNATAATEMPSGMLVESRLGFRVQGSGSVRDAGRKLRSMTEEKQHTYRCSPDIHSHVHSDSFTLTDDEEDRDEFFNSRPGNTIRSSYGNAAGDRSSRASAGLMLLSFEVQRDCHDFTVSSLLTHLLALSPSQCQQLNALTLIRTEASIR